MSWKPSGWELSLKWMLGKSKVKGSTEAWLVTTLGMLITRRKQKDREASTLQWWRPTEPSVTQNLGHCALKFFSEPGCLLTLISYQCYLSFSLCNQSWD